MSGKWTNAQWKEWRTAQKAGWTPEAKPKKSTISEDVKARASQLQSEINVALHLPVGQDAAEKKTWSAKKNAAHRIRHCLAMIQHSTNPTLLAELEIELADARKATRKLTSPHEAAKELTQPLAEAEDKVHRSTKHFDVARGHLEEAVKEVDRLQAELKQLVSSINKPKSKRPRSSMSSSCGFQDMAGLMTTLQASSVHQDGKVLVDPDILNKLSTAMINGQLQNQEAEEVEESETDTFTDPYADYTTATEMDYGEESESNATLQRRLAQKVLFSSGSESSSQPLFRKAAVGHKKARLIPIRRVSGKINPGLQLAEAKTALEGIKEAATFVTPLVTREVRSS